MYYTHHLEQPFQKLWQAREVALSLNYDTIVAQDISGSRKGLKRYFTGNWLDIVREMYMMDSRYRHYYEVVCSSPFSPTLARKTMSSTRLLPDRGQYGARFVVDIDCEILQHDVERWDRLASLLCRCAPAPSVETLSRIAVTGDGQEATKGGGGGCLKSDVTKTLHRLDTLLFHEASAQSTLERLRVALLQWIHDTLGALGFIDDAIKFVALDASCFKSRATIGPSPSHQVCKLSLHLHFPDLLLRQHAVDGAILAEVLNAALVGDLLLRFASFDRGGTGTGDEDSSCALDVLCMRAMLIQEHRVPHTREHTAQCYPIRFTRTELSRLGVIDASIYGEHRCFRMWLSTKQGQSRPLQLVNTEDGTVDTRPVVSQQRFMERMQQLRISKYGVPPSPQYHQQRQQQSHDIVLGYEMSMQAVFPPIPITCRHRLESRTAAEDADYSGVQWERIWIDESLLRRTWSAFEDTTHRPVAPRSASKVAAAHRRVQRQEDAEEVGGHTDTRMAYQLVRGNMTIYTDMGAALMASEMIESVHYHCPTCDCTPHDISVAYGEESGPPDLNPSACCTVTSDLNLALYCFNCAMLFVVRPVFDYHGFQSNCATHTVNSQLHRYFPVERLRPLVVQSMQARVRYSVTHPCRHSCSRPNRPLPRQPILRPLIAINACMGSGKTFAAASVSTLPCVKTVIVVTHRRSLARQLASRFKATCYLDVPADEELDQFDRLVVVVNSLWRVKNTNKYRMLIVDEAGFVRRHLVGATFTRDRVNRGSAPFTSENILDLLATFLFSARCILLLQDGLTDDDVALFTSLRGTQSRVVKLYMPPRDRRKYEMVDDFFDWLAELQETVTAAHKVFVACSRLQDAAELYAFFVEHHSDSGRRKYALVCSQRMLPKTLRTADDFVTNYRQFDVCFTTSCLETGVSLTNHFTHVFGCFRRSPLHHCAQAQLVHRARDPCRTIIWCERGSTLARRTNVQLLQEAWQVRRQVIFGSAPPQVLLKSVVGRFLRATTLDVIAEEGDTHNNNAILWMDHRSALPIASSSREDEAVRQLKRTYIRSAQCVRRTARQVFISTPSAYMSDIEEAPAVVAPVPAKDENPELRQNELEKEEEERETEAEMAPSRAGHERVHMDECSPADELSGREKRAVIGTIIGKKRLRDSESQWTTSCMEIMRGAERLSSLFAEDRAACSGNAFAVTTDTPSPQAHLGRKGRRIRNNWQDKEQLLYHRILTSEVLCQRLFVFLAFVDYRAQCVRGGLCIDAGEASPATAPAADGNDDDEDNDTLCYWHAIRKWMTGTGVSRDESVQHRQQAVIEVLRAVEVCDHMFGSIFPPPGSEWHKTPTQLDAVCTVLESWTLPASFPRSSVDSSESIRKLTSIARKPIRVVEQLVRIHTTHESPNSARDHRRSAASTTRTVSGHEEERKHCQCHAAIFKAKRGLGTSITRYLHERLRLAVVTAQRSSNPVAKTRPWSALTFAMVGLGLKPCNLPVYMEDYHRARWGALTSLYTVQGVLDQYQRPSVSTLETEEQALGAVLGAIGPVRRQLTEISQLRLRAIENSNSSRQVT